MSQPPSTSDPNSGRDPAPAAGGGDAGGPAAGDPAAGGAAAGGAAAGGAASGGAAAEVLPPGGWFRLRVLPAGWMRASLTTVTALLTVIVALGDLASAWVVLVLPAAVAVGVAYHEALERLIKPKSGPGNETSRTNAGIPR
ncbi:hypothetical protein [Frankia sp. AgB32]|uniref:hypothetical protein n=1 Tax=Frankia sp. AgB32 TaxID=631119 RepID=UPI002010B2FB|nr:hypothetical protein [Frankia sp. AgB32]MCK9895568.1 hypothetical protein [Frankia sp. AgB32]